MSITRPLGRAYSKNCVYQHGPFGWRHYAILYAIEAPDARKFKIGRTVDMGKRFGGISAMSPVPLTLRGSVWLPEVAEAEAHMYLQEHRSHGEWFDEHPVVTNLVSLIAAKKVLEISAILELDRMLMREPETDRERFNE